MLPSPRECERESLPLDLLLRLARYWSLARTSGASPLPIMSRQVEHLSVCVTLVPAADSLLQLVEAQLGRPLQFERPCAARLSADEAALLMLLRMDAEAIDPPPHGLSGALQWAVRSVRMALGLPAGAQPMPPAPAPGSAFPAAARAGRAAVPAVCPFRRSAPLGSSFPRPVSACASHAL